MPEPDTYPLVVDQFESQDLKAIGAWSKGHQDPEQFLLLAQEWWKQTSGPLRGTVVHAWWRCIPRKGATRGYSMYAAVPRSRGSFPVSFVMFPYAIDGAL